MKKKFTIEVPLYKYPLEHLVEINLDPDIQIILYGGYPNSPLNGGRLNYSIDGYLLNDFYMYRLSQKQLNKLTKSFFKTVTTANKNNIPFFLAFTNMFITQKELTPENLKPIEFLIHESSKIKNGVILNNIDLEDFLRKKYNNSIQYTSSCTKYVIPEKILSPNEVEPRYQEDSQNYDYVVLTPQHSRNKELLKRITKTSNNIVAIVNTYCSDKCNSYHHYVFTSRENKKSLLTLKAKDILIPSTQLILKKVRQCSVFQYRFRKKDIEEMANKQIEAGIRNFKIGRGLGSECLDQLVSLLKNKTRPNR